MRELFQSFGRWATSQFPNQTSLGKVNHLKKEVIELSESIESGQTDVVEIADCFGLLFSICDIENISYAELKDAIEYKLRENKSRVWPDKPDLDGSFSHIKPIKNNVGF